jgi:hypothetical protein
LKLAQTNSSRDPISKNPSQKIGLVEWLKVKAQNSSPSMGEKHKIKSSGHWSTFRPTINVK